MASETGVTFDEFSQGGGLIDDADVTIVKARFSSWDYNGKITAPVLALKVDLEDAEGNIHEQYMSSGELRFFVPSGDGTQAIPVGEQSKLNINTNAVAFIVSVMNADTKGELAAKLKSGNVSVLDGTKVHIIRKAQPKRAGIIQQPAGDGPQREKTHLTVEKIIAYSWESGAAAGKATAKPAAGKAAAPAAAAPAAAAANGDIAEKTLSFLQSQLAEAGGTLKKSQLAGKVFGSADMKAEAAPVRNAIVALIVKDDWLGSLAESGVTFDKANNTVSLG